MKHAGWIGAIVVLSMIATPLMPAASAGQSGQTSQTQAGQPGSVAASAYTVQVTGTVTSVDRQSGKLTLNGPEGEINARFPAAALRHVRRGDMVTLAVGLMEQDPAPSQSGSSSSSGSSRR